MSKKLFQDIVKTKTSKKETTFNSGLIPKSKKIWETGIENKPKPLHHTSPPPPPKHYPRVEPEYKEGMSRYGLWVVALISIVFLLFAFSYLFSGAKVTIDPKVKDLDLNQNLFAVKDSSSSDLPFDLVVLDGEETKTIQSGEEKDVNEKAKGTVIIYNNFSSTSQVLSVETRLEGSNGKIYKTDKKITVPGMIDVETPGSVEVGIHASEAGTEYNSGPLDFKIVGFKGSAKYEKFYARSKGEIEGGLKGKLRQVAEADRISAVAELKIALKDKLFQKIADQIPSGFVLYKDAIFLNIDEEEINPSQEAMVSIKIKGTLYGFLFDQEKLTKKIIEANGENSEGSDVYIPNIKDLVFSLPNKDNISFTDVKNINFNLSGSVKIVWRVDSEKLVTDLLGKRKKDFNQILSEYPNILSANLVIKPAWKMSFPEKIDDINIIINYPE